MNKINMLGKVLDMENTKIKKNIYVNKYIYIYICYVLSILIGDFVNFLKFIFKINIEFNAILFSPVLIPLIFIILKRWFNLNTKKINIFDIIVIVFIIGLTLTRLPIPERGGDTINYHVPIQQTRFLDNMNYNFLPLAYATFMLPLGDGLFYPFRYLLGYRAGTIFNTLVIILMYIQVSEFIETYLKQKNIVINKYLPSLFSICIISTEYILMNLSTYMIDLVGIPILIELIKVVVFSNKYKRIEAIYISFLIGITVALKFTFLIFIIVPLIFYIYKYRKNINITTYLICFFISVIPISIYLIYNYISIGNPVFHLYNNIFKSEYFYSDAPFRDERWGPNSFVKSIIWPIYVLFHPNLFSEKASYSGRISICYIVCVTLVLKLIIKRRQENRNLFILSVFFVIGSIFWGVTTGYIRYMLYLEVFGGIIVAIVIIENYLSIFRYTKILSGGISILLLAQISYGYYCFTIKDLDWGDRLINRKSILENINMVFKDRQITDDYSDLNNVECWVITGDNAGYTLSLKDNVPTINLKLNWWKEETAKTKEATSKFLETNKNKKMFTIYNPYNGDFDNVLKLLDSNNLHITNINAINDYYLNGNDQLFLIQLEYGTERKETTEEKENLLKDNSFEQITTNKQIWTNIDVGKQLINDGKAEDGDYYVKASVDTGICQRVNVIPSKIYKLTFYSKAENELNTKTRLQVNWYNGLNTTVSASVVVVDSTTEWKKYEMKTICPANVDNALIIINSNDKYNVDFDNVTFSEEN